MLLLIATVTSLFGFCVLRYWKHPASALGVIPFLVGLGVVSYALDKLLEHDTYIVVGYASTLLVAGIVIMIWRGRHIYRREFRGCATCRDPLKPGIQLGVKDLEKTPYISSEDMGYHAGWDGEAVMMSRAKYRCSACSREFYGKTGYSMLSERLK